MAESIKARQYNDDLHKAAGDGGVADVKRLLDQGADVSAKAKNGETALYKAAENGHEAVVQLLLDRGADVAAQAKNGETALYKAAENGHEAVVRLLLDRGADIAAKAKNGETALHKAAENGRGGVVLLLLDCGAEVTATDEYEETALHEAAENGQEAVVRLLLDRGADVTAKDEYGETALHEAAKNGHEAVVRLLLDEEQTGRVSSVAFSPDAKRLASSSGDKTVRLWDAETGECLHTLKGHTAWVSSVAFSPDGRWLASASYDRIVRLWDAVTGQCLQMLELQADSITSVAFSPDGQRLASASSDQTVCLWNTVTGECLQTLEGHSDSITSVAFSPDGKRLASASGDRTVRLWDAETGQCLHTLKGHTGWVWSVAFSSDGRWLVSASGDNTVRLWDAEIGECVGKFMGHTAWVSSAAFSLDGKRLASASGDQTVRLWNTETGQCLRTLEGHTDSITSVAFSPDGKRLASASGDRTVRLWDAETGAELHKLESVALSSRVDIVEAKNNERRTALSLAAENGHEAVVSRLLDYYNADVMARAKNGETALHWAVENGHEAVVRLLLDHKAEVEVEDNNGRTALSLADENGHEKLVRLLREKRKTPPLNITERSVCENFYALVVDFCHRERSGDPPPQCQEQTVFDLVYGPETILSKIPEAQEPLPFRWIHLPANNMVWVKDLMKRISLERHDIDYPKLIEFVDMTAVERPGSAAHSRFLEPKCETSTNGRAKRVQAKNAQANEKFHPKCPKLALYMPYLTFETSCGRGELSKAIESAKGPTKGMGQRPSTMGGRRTSTGGNRETSNSDDRNSKNEMLILAYLKQKQELGLHVLRTLHQFHYNSPSRVDVSRQDGLLKDFIDPLKDFMVGQLWLWVIDEKTIITSFPQQWDQKPGQDLSKRIVDHIREKNPRQAKPPQLSSVYDMATLIMCLCMSFVDECEAEVKGERERYLHIYERSINEAIDRVYEKFNELIKNSYHNIDDEILLARDISNIVDELDSITSVLKFQADLSNKLSGRFSRNDMRYRELVRYYQERSGLKRRIQEIGKMKPDADRILKSINDLLDLRQKQANISEAHYGRKTTTVILVFTLVTVIFLPMSFLVSLFTLNVTSFPHESGALAYPPHWIFSRIFGISAAIIVLFTVPALLAFRAVIYTWLKSLFTPKQDKQSLQFIESPLKRFHPRSTETGGNKAELEKWPV